MKKEREEEKMESIKKVLEMLIVRVNDNPYWNFCSEQQAEMYRKVLSVVEDLKAGKAFLYKKKLGYYDRAKEEILSWEDVSSRPQELNCSMGFGGHRERRETLTVVYPIYPRKLGYIGTIGLLDIYRRESNRLEAVYNCYQPWNNNQVNRPVMWRWRRHRWDVQTGEPTDTSYWELSRAAVKAKAAEEAPHAAL